MLRTQGMSFLEHKECPSSNTRNVFLRPQGMFFFEHKECLSSNTRNVLLRTQGMSCFEHKECLSWNTRNVLLRTRGMSFLEHKECLSPNTRNFSAVLCALPFRQCNKWNTAMCSDPFGCVRTHSDVFGRNRIRLSTFGGVWTHLKILRLLMFFRMILISFGCFLTSGAYFY